MQLGVFFMLLYGAYTTPLKPIKAMANKPAVIRAVGIPCMALGSFTMLRRSRNPANSTNAMGVGGIAFALAAQDTIKNLFGGFTIFVDKPFKLGERAL